MSDRPASEANPSAGALASAPTSASGSAPVRTPARGAVRRLAIIGLVAIAVAALVALGAQLGGVEGLRDRVAELGALGPLVFVLAYAMAIVAFVPGSVLTLAAGTLFGLLAGVAYVFVAASLGACASFLIARYAARGWIESRLAGNERFAAIDGAVAREGLKITTLLRLSPIFPFSLLNYALGLTAVRLRDYTVACFGMLPGTFLYVYLGAIAGDAASAAGGGAGSTDTLEWITRGVGLAATIAVTIVITRVARRALAQEALG